MIENISKFLYLGLGLSLFLIALTSFYDNNVSFINLNKLYNEVKAEESSWINAATRETKNPLKIIVSDTSVIESGLVFSGREAKIQLVGWMRSSKEVVIYKEGVEVLVSDYPLLYQNIEDGEQLLITYDSLLKAVYIVTV